MITLNEARPALKAAVETQGRDFVYNPDNGVCFYVPRPAVQPDDPKGVTGCIIGVALTILGETRHTVAYPHTDLSVGFEGSVSTLAGHFKGMMTDEARTYFELAQRAQDSGCPWGEAYDLAEEWALTRDYAAVNTKLMNRRRENFGPSA